MSGNIVDPCTSGVFLGVVLLHQSEVLIVRAFQQYPDLRCNSRKQLNVALAVCSIFVMLASWCLQAFESAIVLIQYQCFIQMYTTGYRIEAASVSC